jgi:hypothetical protein
MAHGLLPFEILHRFFVFLGRRFGFEHAEVSTFAGLGIFLPRIEAIAALNFSNHGFLSGRPKWRHLEIFPAAEIATDFSTSLGKTMD